MNSSLKGDLISKHIDIDRMVAFENTYTKSLNVNGSAIVADNITINGSSVFNNVEIDENLIVDGSTIFDNLTVTDLTVNDPITTLTINQLSNTLLTTSSLLISSATIDDLIINNTVSALVIDDIIVNNTITNLSVTNLLVANSLTMSTNLPTTVVPVTLAAVGPDFNGLSINIVKFGNLYQIDFEVNVDSNPGAGNVVLMGTITNATDYPSTDLIHSAQIFDFGFPFVPTYVSINSSNGEISIVLTEDLAAPGTLYACNIMYLQQNN